MMILFLIACSLVLSFEANFLDPYDLHYPQTFHRNTHHHRPHFVQQSKPDRWRSQKSGIWDNNRINHNGPGFNRDFFGPEFNTGFGSGNIRPNRDRKWNGFNWNVGPVTFPPSTPSMGQGSADISSIFKSEFTTMRPTTATIAIPGMGTTWSPCEVACLTTSQFDPVCGDNGVTYTNMQRYNCALRCGKRVRIRYRGACPKN